MGIKSFFNSFKDKRNTLRNEEKSYKSNIYKEVPEKEILIEKVETEYKNISNQIPSDIKIEGDLCIMSTPITDYHYEELELTLYEQKEFYKEERNKLSRLSDGVKVYVRYYKKLSSITPLIKSVNFKNMAQLNNLKLDIILPIIKSDLGMFLSEFNKVYKNAAKSSYNTRVGIRGESAVERELELYRDKILSLSNIRLEVEGTTVESDNIVISHNGVFCIEVKNYGVGNGGIIKISKDGLWTRFNSKGQEIEVEDVTAQVYRHIGITQRFLNEELNRKGIKLQYIDIKPIIVIANKDIMIENDSDIPILRTSNIYHYIATYKVNDVLDEKYWEPIEKVLIENDKGAKPYPVKLCADKIKQNYKEIYYKLRFFHAIDKQVGLTNIVEEIALSEHRLLIDKLSKYSKKLKTDDRKISHVEEVSLRALIDELHLKGAADRGVYEAILLKCFNVVKISDLQQGVYEHIYECLKHEISIK